MVNKKCTCYSYLFLSKNLQQFLYLTLSWHNVKSPVTHTALENGLTPWEQVRTTLQNLLMLFWPCIIVYTCFNYQLNAQFLYSITICMLLYNPWHVSSITTLIFRKSNFIITASGIVTLCKRLYSTTVESVPPSTYLRFTAFLLSHTLNNYPRPPFTQLRIPPSPFTHLSISPVHLPHI